VTGSFVGLAADIGGAALSVTPTTAEGVTPGVILLPLASTPPVLMGVTANTVDEMVPSTYDVTIVPGAPTTYDVGTLNLGTCGSLQYSGSTDRMDFALTPNGQYSNYIRVTNPSNTSGNVVMTVWNDAGDDVSFDLSAIAGIDSNVLKANASTPLVTINDIYAACRATDATFDATTSKLRIQVRGEFGDDAVEGFNDATVGQTMGNTRLADGVVIQGLTQSVDGNSFFMIKN